LLGGNDGAGRFRIVYGRHQRVGRRAHVPRRHLHQDEADAATVDFTNTGEGKALQPGRCHGIVGRVEQPDDRWTHARG
jgi:hypothetical protein